MTVVRRAEERIHDRRSNQESWITFDPANALDGGFGAVEALSEIRLAPRATAARNERKKTEIFTYVQSGALVFEDPTGPSRLLQAGEFQILTSGPGIRHGRRNASRRDWVRFYQIELHDPQAELEARHVEKRFSAAERRAGLCVVASLDARAGALPIHQDVVVCSALLDVGQHMVQELSGGRRAWLHVVQGQVLLDDVLLSAGDGAGISAKRAVSFTAGSASEVLLVNLGERRQKPVLESGSSRRLSAAATST
jgi:redox-sensitive bicupin YhaK (pirin superfamily)